MYENSTGSKVTIPFHGSKTIHPKTLKSIMEQAGIEEWPKV
jgi:predicted RNA binding protein YcfA (HicA-like mRNA interferase family)